ncbi:MAG: flagellin [Methanosarcinaceae archaeon]|nr:flagellin [Methanosarcinaceae archaeon]
MKSNRTLSMKKDTHAQVGIGTLIIFIAMVLIAAVAAAVLIQTSGVLQQKAQSTGQQATQEVSSNLIIKSIDGIRATESSDSTNQSNTLDLLRLRVGLNVGSGNVDMNQVVITITDGTNTNDLVYADNEKSYSNNMANFSGTASASTNLIHLLNDTQSSPGDNSIYFYTVDKVRDEDGSFSQSTPVLNTGDLITVYISTLSGTATGYDTVGSSSVISPTDTSLDVETRTSVSLILTPETGVITQADFMTPSTYGTKTTIQLYP